MAEARLQITNVAVTDGTLAELEREWLVVEARSSPPPYLTFAWLESWIEVYEPRRLRALRVVDPDERVIGLGLVEELPLRRIRFAGAPVTPIRGMLSSPGREAQVWDAVANWIASGSCSYGSLSATGIEAHRSPIPGRVLAALPWFSLDLPGTFDEYLASLGRSTRKVCRRRLRAAEKEGVVAMTLPPESAGRGLAAFLSLHRARAEARRELHPAVDHRMLAMLGRVLARGKPELRVNVVERNGTTLAAAICLYDDDTCWGYNMGFDPSAARLSPGVLVHLQEIRAALEHGSRRSDLGQGDHAYKRLLGGKPIERLKLELTSQSAAGRVMRWAAEFRNHAQRDPRLRAAALAARRRAARLRAPIRRSL